MDIKTWKTILQIGGLLISFAGTLLDATIREMDTEKAVNKYMDKHLDDAVAMALDETAEDVVDTTATEITE